MSSIPTTYPVMEVFPTLQGEGHYSGKPAYFIRLAGCDVGCAWCDVKESWPVGEFPELSIEQIVSGAGESGLTMIVITGGEPCMYDLTPLVSALQDEGLRVHLETSGAHPIRGGFDWVTLSPKKFKACLPDSFLRADELKVIVVNKHDLQWAVQQSKEVSTETLLYIQPEWSRRDKVQAIMLDFLQSDNGALWNFSAQTHKYLGIR
jgi:7-carboxy-7-deazaguanine synthase